MKRLLTPLSATVVLVALAIIGIVLMTMTMDLRFRRVDTVSMTPTLNPGTRVITYMPDELDLQPQDVITFYDHDRGKLVTHTFLGYNDDYSLRTKGDGNLTVDDPDIPVMESDVVGVAWRQVDILTPQFWGGYRGPVSAVAVILLLWLLVTRPRMNESDEKPEENLPVSIPA